MAVLAATVPKEILFTCSQYIFYVSDDYLGRKNIKNMFISNLKPPWLNYMMSSLRQRQNLHIYDFETENS